MKEHARECATNHGMMVCTCGYAAIVLTRAWKGPILDKSKPTFHARDREVYKRPTDEWVCRAKSNTYAIRIAKALDQYQPDRRGQ
jgi:hypothetical protein